MYATRIAFLILSAATAFCAPDKRQDAAASDSALLASLTALASSQNAAISSAEAYASFVSSIFSGQPTLPASVAQVLATAQPTDVAAVCTLKPGQIPSWLASLPSDVGSAWQSYTSAEASWLKAHPGALSSLTAYEASLYGTAFARPTVSVVNPLNVCSALSSAQAAATATATGTAAGTAAASASSKGGAAGTTGTVGVGLAGVVAVLGLVAAL